MGTVGFGGQTPTGTAGRAAAGVRRAGTIVRSPLEGRRERKEQGDGDMRASDVRVISCRYSYPLSDASFRLSPSSSGSSERPTAMFHH